MPSVGNVVDQNGIQTFYWLIHRMNAIIVYMLLMPLTRLAGSILFQEIVYLALFIVRLLATSFLGELLGLLSVEDFRNRI